jgi:hypothetical protein
MHNYKTFPRKCKILVKSRSAPKTAFHTITGTTMEGLTTQRQEGQKCSLQHQL